MFETLKNAQDMTMLGGDDTMDLFRILIHLLKQIDELLPNELHAACQGALAINQATGLARRAGGTSVKNPTTMVKRLIRYMICFLQKKSTYSPARKLKENPSCID